VIEAHLHARLLGVKVLRVDGTVLLAPSHLVEAPRVVQQQRARPPADGSLVPGGDLAHAARLLADNRARLGGPGPRPLGPGS
jgi:hypothetical protein